jgi:hypothetical protein
VRALHVYTCVACSVRLSSLGALRHCSATCTPSGALLMARHVLRGGSGGHDRKPTSQWSATVGGQAGRLLLLAASAQALTATTGMGVEPTCAREYTHPSSVGVAPTCRVQRRRKENSHPSSIACSSLQRARGSAGTPLLRGKIQIRDLGHDFVVDFGAHFTQQQQQQQQCSTNK